MKIINPRDPNTHKYIYIYNMYMYSPYIGPKVRIQEHRNTIKALVDTVLVRGPFGQAQDYQPARTG